MGLQRLGFRQINGRFFARLEEVLATLWAARIAFQTTTDQESEEYRWLGMSPAMREWIGGRHIKSLRDEGITIKNRKFEATLGFDVDELRRNKSPQQVLVRVNEMGRRAAEHWHKLLTTLVVTPGNAYDGTPFYGSTHQEGESPAQRNQFAAGQITELNVGTPSNPTPSELEVILPLLVQQFLGYVDDQGEPMHEGATEFLIMHPVNMTTGFSGVLNNRIITDGGGAAHDNRVLNFRRNNGLVQFDNVANPRLSDPNKFYMFRTDGDVKPFIMQDEPGGFMTEWNEQDRFKNDRVYYGVKAWRNVGTFFWQYAIEVTLS